VRNPGISSIARLEERMRVSPAEVRAEAAGRDEQGFQWPIAFMKREDFRKGECLFKIGDPADKLFYILKGLIRLPELGRFVKAGQVMGEMGIFSPNKQRSATAFAEEEVIAYTMGGDEVRQLMRRDPELATNLLEVILKRMMEHLKAEAEARERLKAELLIARDIQLSMLPRTFPPFPGRKEFDIYALMEPANEVGGDLYDFFLVERNRLCVLIGDVSGKGVPAALFMALSKTLLRSEAMRGYRANEILARVNNALCAENHECMFVTVFCLILNTQTGEAEFCAAGHNPPLICSGDGMAEFLKAEPGSVVGFEENLTYPSGTIRLKRGATMLLYTDGVTEAENPKQELFSEDRLRCCVCALGNSGVREIIAGVKQELARHAQGYPQSDDVTMVALRYKGPVNEADGRGGTGHSEAEPEPVSRTRC
jgi:serine phosphatase RsbU (regulator of sigma subunit)